MPLTFKADQLETRLRELRERSPAVQGSIISSAEGLPIATDLAVEADEEQVAALSAATASLGERIVSELRRGLLDQIFISGKQGYIIVTQISPLASLTVLGRGDARLLVLLLDIDFCVEELRALL